MIITDKVRIMLSNEDVPFYTDDKDTIHCQLPISRITSPAAMLRQVKEKEQPRLIHSLKEFGQKQPLLVQAVEDEKGMRLDIFDGTQRKAAMEKIDPMYSANITISEDVDLLTSIVTNVDRVNQNAAEVSKAVLLLCEANYSFESISKKLNLKEGYAEKYFALSYLNDIENEALKSDSISLAQASVIANARKNKKNPVEESDIATLLDIALGKGGEKKSAEEMKQVLKTARVLYSKNRKGGTTAKVVPKFEVEEKFSMDRLQLVKEQCRTIQDQIDLDGYKASDRELAIIGTINSIYQVTADDIAKQKEIFCKRWNLESC